MKKALTFSYFFVCFSMLLTIHAHAYIEPSVVTYGIQIIAGVLVAVGAAVGIYWRRAKRKVQEKLGIDENAKKEIEDDVVELADEEKK